MNYQRNLKYFLGVSYKGPVWMIVIGAICTLFIAFPCFSSENSAGAGVVFLLIGLGLLGGGIALCVTKSKGVVSDAEYDAEVAKMLNNIQGRALQKLGIDIDEVKEIAPISFDGYGYKGARRAKKGADGLWRTDIYKCVVLFFSNNEVHCYTYLFNTVDGTQSENTDVYFYRDIVSVSTNTSTDLVLNNNVTYEEFVLTTAGGTSLNVSIRDTGNAQRSINAMRQLLRAKKAY